jgi:hypothetical protein
LPPVFDDDNFLAYQRRLGVKPQKYSREIVFKQQNRTTAGNSEGGRIVQQDGKPFPLETQYSFFGGWHVGVNFACGLQHRFPDGRHFLYSYNCSASVDELYDMNSDDASNLIDNPDDANVREEMIHRLGTALKSDPRWGGYWTQFRLPRFASLPLVGGDMQLLASHA